MKCYSCGEEMIWNNDFDLHDEENEWYKLLTIFSCPKCDSMIECYHDRKEQE